MVFLSSSRVENASAWGATTHQHVVAISTSYLENVVQDLGENGTRWPQLFKIYDSELKKGAIAPDREFRDFSNHVYHVNNPDLFPNAPNEVKKWYNSFKTYLQTKDFSEAVWSAGVMSHYIFDLCQPMHTDEVFKEDDGSQNGGISGHYKYEQDINAKVDTLEFQNHTPRLLERSVEETTVGCAIYSNQYHDDLVETYWNGSFWTPWVEETTTDLLNYAAKTFANIIFTAIKECDVELPDFTPYAINMEVEIPKQIYQGTSYTGKILVTDWQGTPLDANVHVVRTWMESIEEENATNGAQPDTAGPFIIFVSCEELGVFTFELESIIPGVIQLEITVEKANLISKNEIIEIRVLEVFESSSSITTQYSESSETHATPSLSVFFVFVTLISIILVRKPRN